MLGCCLDQFLCHLIVIHRQIESGNVVEKSEWNAELRLTGTGWRTMQRRSRPARLRHGLNQ